MSTTAVHYAGRYPMARNVITVIEGNKMKVYIVTEWQENIIRFATLDKKLAEQIVGAFANQSLKIHEVELLGDA